MVRLHPKTKHTQANMCIKTQTRLSYTQKTRGLFPMSGKSASFNYITFQISAHCYCVSKLWQGEKQTGPGKEASPQRQQWG